MKHGPPAARAQPRTPARAIPPSGRGRGSRSLFGRRSHVLSTRLSHVLHQRPHPAEGSRLQAAPLIHRLGRVGWIYLAEIVWLDFFFFFHLLHCRSQEVILWLVSLNGAGKSPTVAGDKEGPTVPGRKAVIVVIRRVNLPGSPDRCLSGTCFK